MGRITIREIAAQAGVLPSAVHTKVRRMGLPVKFVHFDDRRHSTLASADAERVLATYAKVDRDLEGWLTTYEAARLLGMNHQVLARKVAAGKLDIERRRLVGVDGGQNWRYEPTAVRALASTRPVRPPGVPRGALSAAQVCELLGVSRTAVRYWVGQGLTRGLTAKGRMYFKPADLLHFFETRTLHKRARPSEHLAKEHHLKVLREYLATPTAERAA